MCLGVEPSAGVWATYLWATTLKRNDSYFSSHYQLPQAQLVWGLTGPLPSMLEFCLARSCRVLCRWSQTLWIHSTRTTSSPEAHIPQCFSPVYLWYSSQSLFQLFPEPWSGSGGWHMFFLGLATVTYFHHFEQVWVPALAPAHCKRKARRRQSEKLSYTGKVRWHPQVSGTRGDPKGGMRKTANAEHTLDLSSWLCHCWCVIDLFINIKMFQIRRWEKLW